ncbi:hypothetical protein [Gordonia sp. (in: high G+C Gram-positive bacteria)]|uniref:hypothetical protein n=1 Tax=Gordonia sp. (in: high G+C Gram-positive bacteria) TaxID=84139 RepID=UPI003C75DE2B
MTEYFRHLLGDRREVKFLLPGGCSVAPDLLLMGGTYALLTWRPTRLAYAAPLITVIPCLFWMWAVTAWSYGSVNETICPLGHPAWWPSWIPI